MPMLAANALLALQLLSATPPPVALDAATVRICSPGSMEGCETLAAAAIDPTLAAIRGAGQLAFVDPETGMLVAPTQEQLAELRLLLQEDVKTIHEPTMETLTDGTLRLDTSGIVFTLSATRPDTTAKEDR